MSRDIMAGNAKVSVIVPVYNVEKYLPTCLDSIINQTLREIEVIVLNDGSTDGSIEIIRQYKRKDERIKVFEHQNRGLGPTRNRGILLATGDYLSFVDSDDYIKEGALEVLYKAAVERNCDVIEGETIFFFDENDQQILRKSLRGVQDIIVDSNTKEQFYRDYYFSRFYSHNACDKLFRREFIMENNIVFGDNRIIFSEDNWFQLQLFIHTPKISFIPQKFYMYRQHQDSIMHKPKKNLVNRHAQMIKDYNRVLEKLEDHVIEDKVCSLIACDIFTMEALNQININGTWKNYEEEMSKIRNNDDLIRCIKATSKNKAYKLIKNKKRKMYLSVVSMLYSHSIYKVANAFVWLLYKLRGAK
jgi:glycosyltransferase involved in cell wall biosynthesis